MSIIPLPLPPTPETWEWSGGAFVASRATANVSTQGVDVQHSVLTHASPVLLGDAADAPSTGWVLVDVMTLGGVSNYVFAAVYQDQLYLRVSESDEGQLSPPAGGYSGGWRAPQPLATVLPVVGRATAQALPATGQAASLGSQIVPLYNRDLFLKQNEAWLNLVYDPILNLGAYLLGAATLWMVQRAGYWCFISTVGSTIDAAQQTWPRLQVATAPLPWGAALPIDLPQVSLLPARPRTTAFRYIRANLQTGISPELRPYSDEDALAELLMAIPSSGYATQSVPIYLIQDNVKTVAITQSHYEFSVNLPTTYYLTYLPI